MSIQQLQGVWRFEEAVGWNGRQHPLAWNKTHWMIIGSRGLSFRDSPPEPLRFEFRIEAEDSMEPKRIQVSGSEFGDGFYECDDEFLMVCIGHKGVTPPRFESTCGNYFAFTRDSSVTIPSLPTWPRDPIESLRLGTIVWSDSEQQWQAMLAMEDLDCELRVNDDLVPISQFLSELESLVDWLAQSNGVALTAAETVANWIDEDPEWSAPSITEIAETISVLSIDSTNGNYQVFASTSIPIDHIIRLNLEPFEREFRITGSCIEG